MIDYAITLPRTLPSRFFDYLGEGAHNGIRSAIDSAYNGLSKIARTHADNPAEALGNVVFREARQKKINPRTASSILKMLVTSNGRYAFEIPEKRAYDAEGHKLDAHETETAQIMDLAIELAEARSCRPEDCFSEASKLIVSGRMLQL